MENQAIREFLKLDKEEEKNEYILDLSHSIQEYVKSGIKNDVLSDFQQYVSEIKCELTKAIDEHTRLMNEICDQMKNNNFAQKSIEQFQQELDKSMKKIIYLSHLNVLSVLYMNEMEQREEQKNCERVTKEFPKLLEIAVSIDEKRRINSKELREQFKLSDKEYHAITVNCKTYFNLRRGHDNEIKQVSLSPKGKKYLKCMRDAQHSYTQSQVDAIVAKNCEVLIHVIPESLFKGMPQRINFNDITPQTERSIQFSFDQAIFDVTRLSSKAYPIGRAGTFEVWEKERYDGIREDFAIPILPIRGNC